ncbi:MAG: hypothetical protein GY906_35250 [bacterium]|nr:hypothetical protein [bacterium]
MQVELDDPGQCGKPLLLTFNWLPGAVRLTGMPTALAQAFSESWCAQLNVDQENESSVVYSVEEQRLPERLSRSRGPGRTQAHGVQIICGPEEDRVLTPLGQAHLTPGRTLARVYRQQVISRPQPGVEDPLEAAIQHFLALQGVATLHAAALNIGGRGVLILGPSGAGKTTLALAWQAAGARIVSDDSVLLRLSSCGRVMAHPFRSSLLIRQPSLGVASDRVVEAARRMASENDCRWTVERTSCPGAFADSAPPEVVFSVRRDRRRVRPRFRSLNSAEMLGLVLEGTSSHFLSPRYAEEQHNLLQVFKSLVETARCFEVCLGRTLLTHPEHTLRELTDAISNL